MIIRHNITGKTYETVEKAVDAFKCPGPCSPDCELYPLKPLKNGSLAHMCHDEYVKTHPNEVLEAINCRKSLDIPGEPQYCPHCGKRIN